MAQALACLLALSSVSGGEGGATTAEAVREDDRFTLEELLSFPCRELAHGSEGRSCVGCELLDGMLGFDAQLTCHLIAIVGLHIGIELLVIASDRSSYRGRMGDEEGLDLWGVEMKP